MAETTSGIEMMRKRMERASRRPPAPRRPRAAGADEVGEEPSAAEGAAPASAAAGGAQGTAARRPAQARRTPAPARLGPDLPAVNLAIRVRRPLDDRLANLIHALRADGVRTSKVEVVEMLLWELAEDDVAGLVRRLARFREWAPRGASAPLGRGGPA